MQQVKLNEVVKRFEDHLSIENNYRIILSGKFGIGKTFFLKEFFKSKSKGYNTIFINPVNYVVSPNEDIFELIKLDIIKQLYTEKANKRSTASVLEKIALFASGKPQHFLKFITSSFKKINPFLEIADDIYDGLAKLYSEYKDYEKTLEEKFKISEERIEDFAASFNNRTGSIFEDDFITKTIREKLSELKKGKKKNVLIIDDLDRIDPEHVFRILNILSAHNDSFGSKNKFGFDSIIVVCDNENIKNIFYHKYGKDVDFDGYMDKFYSTEIFTYKNDEALKFYLKSTFISDEDSSGLIELTLFVLSKLIDINRLTVRKIIKHRYKFENEPFILQEQKGLQETKVRLRYDVTFISSWNLFFVESTDLEILKFFKLISFIYGDFNDFYSDLNILSNLKAKIDSEEVNKIILFLALQKHIATNSGDKLFFQLGYGKDYTDETVLQQLSPPEPTLIQKRYRLKLNWDRSNPYDGSYSYFQNAVAVDSDNHQYIGNRPKRFVQINEIFKTLTEIISSCYEKGYLLKSGIILHSNYNNE